MYNQFLQHTWPGNIRELVNVLERIYSLEIQHSNSSVHKSVV
ncbi:hypothetical protein ACT4UL_25025 [Bacillus sp. HC-TM]